MRVPTFCGKDCGGNACPLLAVVEAGRVVRLESNPAGRGIKACPRGYALHEAHYAPDRLTAPLIASGPRGSGRYREASWDEALSLVSERLGAIRAREGPASVMALGSAGSVGAIHDSQALLARFLGATGGSTLLSSNYSNGAAGFVLPFLFGTAASRSGWDATTVRDSRLIVLWGANVLEARLGAELGAEIAAAARAGVPVVYLDPRRTMTAKALGARWIPIRPGTDAAMMLAVLYELFRLGAVDRSASGRLSVGLPELERYVSGGLDGTERSPAWAEPRCGIPRGVIRDFAAEYAAARPAMLLPGYSIQRVASGEDSYRLTVALQVASGNFGVRGGSTGSLNNRLPGPRVGSLPAIRASADVSVPILRWPDAILEGRAGGYPSDVKAAYVAGFNALGQGADCGKSARALASLEFSVCHELFLTPTARLCDVVLPVLSPLEKEDIGIPWAGNYLLYKRAALAPRGRARSDYDIFSELCERLGQGQAFTEGLSERAWLDRFLDRSEITDRDAFKESGVYLGAERARVGLADFASDPEGRPLPTPSGKVELASQAYALATGRPAIPAWEDRPRDERFPFLLITPKTIRRTHSQNGGGAPWDRGEASARADLGELSLAPLDAEALGLRSGDEAVIANDHGRTLARVALSDDIAPGVACLHEGAWACGPGSANALTGTEGSGPATAPVMHGVPVAISRRG